MTRPDTADPATDGLDELVARWRNQNATVGLAAGIVRAVELGPKFAPELAWTSSSGLADTTSRAPVTVDTVFRVGSISKTVVAAAVLQLVERGMVELDDPVERHLHSWRLEASDAGWAPVTVRQLLTHTGGIGEVRRAGDLLRPMLGLGAVTTRPLPSLAEYYHPALRVRVEPGSKWAYANHGFAALGQLVEDVTGEPLAQRLRTELLDPLGMASSDFEPSARVAGRVASGHALGRRGLRRVTELAVAPWPAGSLYSTVPDMAAYAQGLLAGGTGPGGRVLEEGSVAAMFAPQWQPDPRLPGMGFGFFLDDVAGHRVAGHEGGWPGFISALLVAPDDGVAVFAVTNGGRQEIGQLARQLLRHVLGVSGSAVRDDLPQRPEAWQELLGYYAPARGMGTNARVWMVLGGGAEVVVTADRHLALRGLSPLPALRRGVRLHPDDPKDPLVFRTDAPELGQARVAFRRDEDGHVDALHLGGVLLDTLHKRPAGRNPRPWLIGGAAAATTAAIAAVRR